MKKGQEPDNMENFTVLENKTIGRNFYRMRKIRDKKALDVAKFIGIGEAAYTKYERGESKITVDHIQKVAEFFKIDPIQLLSTASSNFVDNVTNSQVLLSSNFHTLQTYNLEQNQMMLKLMESVLSLSERIAKMIEEKKG
jgi:transcriptional regulator with XRE-family HTH domain